MRTEFGRRIAVERKSATVTDRRYSKRMKTRCAWCLSDPLYIRYHDEEWGVPRHDDRRLFEMLILEGAQAGLSWLTILKRRDGYRKAFDRFDAAQDRPLRREEDCRVGEGCGNYPASGQDRSGDRQRPRLSRRTEGRGKFRPLHLVIRAEKPSRRKGPANVTPEAEAMSRDLKKRGFKFVGATICYAFMQAVGMVNDHAPDCFRSKR